MVFLNCAVESYGDVNGNRMIRPFWKSLNFAMLLLAWAESSVLMLGDNFDLHITRIYNFGITSESLFRKCCKLWYLAGFN